MTTELVNNLIALRKRLIYILIGIVVAFLCLFQFANTLYDLISQPILTASKHANKIIATDVTSPFFTPMKLTLICAVFVSLPNTLYQVWQFLSPAMYKVEKMILGFTTLGVIVLFIIGVLFCYGVILPVFFNFIVAYKSSNIEMMTDITKYFDFVLNLFIVFGFVFETPIVVMILIKFKIISYTKLKQIRPYIFVGAFIIAAILTPPDILSQILLALPLYLLYEFGILCAIVFKL